MIRADDLLRQGVAAVRELIGPPGRTADDGHDAQVAAEAFVGGCEELRDLVVSMLENAYWVPYDVPIGCLEGWLGHRLGARADRSERLLGGEPQRTPYARELEANAEALATLARGAFRASFDHVARAALAALIRGAEAAVRSDDRTAMGLFARALDGVAEALFRRRGVAGDLAVDARVTELLVSLQEPNRLLLEALVERVQVLGVESVDGRGTGRVGGLGANAVSWLLRWALRPRRSPVGAHERLELAIARTAQSVREQGAQEWRWPEPAPYDKALGELETAVAKATPYRELEDDPRLALVQGLAPDDCEAPGVAVYRIAVRWRDALIAARSGVGPGGHGSASLVPLAGAAKGGPRGPVGLSRESAAFCGRVGAWAEAPWCVNDQMSTRPHGGVPGGRELTYLPYARDVASEDLRVFVRQHRARYEEEMAAQGCDAWQREELQGIGVLWGTWPPPPRCEDNPLNGQAWSLAGRIGHRREQWRRRDAPRRRPDRTYRGRVSGEERIVVTEPDGSSRVLGGADYSPGTFTLRPGGAARTILGEWLAADVLGPLADCPACHGGTPRRRWPGWCPTCRGSGAHPGLGLAQLAMEYAVAGRGPEWDLTRSELLDVIVAFDR